MMTDRTFNAVKQWLTIGGTIVALAATWTAMEKQVEQLSREKVDRAEYDRLLRLVERVDDRTQRIESFLCRGRTQDLGCQR